MNAALSLQRMALPLSLAQLAFAANTFATNFFISRVSATALAAALPGFTLAFAVSSFAVSTLGYSATVFASRHGAGDVPGAVASFRAALVLALASFPIFALFVPAARAVLGLFSAAPEVAAEEAAYCDILLLNGFFATVNAVLAGFFTGRGKTRLAGAATTLGFLANIALAPLFIFGKTPFPAHGIRGAGVAAVVSQAVPLSIFAFAILRSEAARRARRVERRDFAEILRLGLPGGLRTLADIGGFFVFAAILAESPCAAAAASTAAFAVNGVFQALPQGLAQAMEITTARARAAARPALVLPGLSLAAAYSALFCVFLALCGMDALSFFEAERDAGFAEQFAGTAFYLVLILGAKGFFESAVLVLQAFLRGCGKTALVFKVQFATSALFWIPSFLAVRAFHPAVPALHLTMAANAILNTAILCRLSARKRLLS